MKGTTRRKVVAISVDAERHEETHLAVENLKVQTVIPRCPALSSGVNHSTVGIQRWIE